MSQRRQLLYYCPLSFGGIADYAHEQAKAIASQGIEVTMLCPEDFKHSANEYVQCRHLVARKKPTSRLRRQLDFVQGTLRDIAALDRMIAEGGFRQVLLASYSEYLAPLWAWRLRRHASNGVVIGAIVHDPVRDYVLGPLWWHRASVASAYSLLREAFVHEEIELECARKQRNFRTTVIPHGPYRFEEAIESIEQTKNRLQIPPSAPVALSFGHIRDAKNLDLILQSIVDFPDLHLIIAGKEQSSTQKPVGHYQQLANQLGIQDRCHWIHSHVPSSEVAALFLASDLIFLTYSASFRSASGVLNAAVQYRRQCLASSGGGNLESVVRQYGLGVFVDPDSVAALKAGIAKSFQIQITPRWDEYLSDHSWNQNACIVIKQLFGPLQQ